MTYRDMIKMKYRTIMRNLGWMLICFSVILLIPIVFCIFYPEEFPNSIYFFESAALSFICGYTLWFFFSNKKTADQHITVHEGAIIVLFAWLGAVFFSALPFVFSGELDFTQAVFESTSGWTTTGLSLVDVSKTSKLILVWRSLTQFFGGAGFAIIMLSSIGGGVSQGIYVAEGRMDNLLPNIKKSTKTILLIYFSYAVAGIIAYKIAGMNLFDSFNHSLTALATGGFSTRVNSIGEFNSIHIEIITIVLMTLGTTGFGIHYLIWERNFKQLKKNVEPWTYLVILLIFIPLLVLALLGPVYGSLPHAIREGVFQAVSALTGTGFSTANLVLWNQMSLFLLTLLMIFGGMMDSTSGGIKLFRIYVIFKSILIEVQRFFLPKGAVKHHVAWKGNYMYKIDDALLRSVLIFTTLYFLNYAIGVGVMVSYGNDLMTSAFEYASALSTVGLSLGITNPGAPYPIIWTETIGMFLGRLEFIVVLYALAKIFRDLRQFYSSQH